MKQITSVIITVFLCSFCWGQTVSNFKASTGDVTVASSASTTLTIQQPVYSAAGKVVTITGANAQCSNTTPGSAGLAFDLIQTQNGTAATATAGTIVALPPNTHAVPFATAFTASNVSGGTVVNDTLSYSSGSIAALAFNGYTLGNTGTGTNYSIKITNTGATSCLARITIFWSEQ